MRPNRARRVENTRWETFNIYLVIRAVEFFMWPLSKKLYTPLSDTFFFFLSF